jgi:ferredoxin-NADP reductase
VTFEARLEKGWALGSRTRGLLFRVLGGRKLDFKAGQHLKLYPSGEAAAARGRPGLSDGAPKPMYFSIASPPSLRDAFELCVTLVEGGGTASEFMHRLPEGNVLRAEGPLGRFVLPEGELPRDAVFVATGSGVAPLRSMLLDLFDRGTRRGLRLLFGARAEADILYSKEWEELEKTRPNFKARFILSRPEEAWTGLKGYVQDQLKDVVPEPGNADYYICGVSKMVEGVKEALKGLGVAEGRVHHERYD